MYSLLDKKFVTAVIINHCQGKGGGEIVCNNLIPFFFLIYFYEQTIIERGKI